ncbi:Gfo/Idh/MocA family oxidoreductase [Lentilitoribacter sp. Alg239-R112]|uniref:Gfo/Idh/MocA family protein n=1 Tax=Lentilitoribacter sp. Alg239-R112 TaxID=2305987 RepID=UPI0013A6F697|nr:Gfo/Idh/MocA family oxidoreductase [Lentilitoribacter sp. Alg239-R112]
MGDVVNLVVVGLGLVGRRHADAIKRLKGVRLTGIVEPNLTSEDIYDEYGVPCFASLADLFALSKPDGVIVATPTPSHVELGLEIISNGCAALIEKPLAVSSVEAENLVKFAMEKQVPLLVGHHRRHNPLIKKAAEIISDGEIGNVRAVHANCWFYKPDHYFDQAPWRKHKGAGPISVNLVHDIDLIRYLCGEISTVQAQSAPSQRGFENEDVASVLLSFENGAVGTVTVSDSIVAPWSWELTSGEYPIYPKTSQSCYKIGGSHGSLSVPDLTIWKHGTERDWWSPITATSIPREASDPLDNQIIHFAKVVLGEEAPLVTGLEGLKTLRVVEAIGEAAQSNSLIKINDFAELHNPDDVTSVHAVTA